MALLLTKINSFLLRAGSTLLRPPVGDETPLGDFNWIYDVKDVIDMLLWPILILVASVGTIYAVVLGVNMARADSTEKREEAKKRVINVLIGAAIIIGLILLLKLFMNYLPKWIGKAPTDNRGE